MGMKLGLLFYGKNIDFALRKLSGPKREDVKGDWRKFHNDELSDLYSSANNQAIESKSMAWFCGRQQQTTA
jgi:hypothetical protein